MSPRIKESPILVGFCLFLPLLLFGFCANAQSTIPITDSSRLVVDTPMVIEHFYDMQVFQFFDQDSLEGKITYSERWDERGNITGRLYQDYKTDKGNGVADVLSISEFNENNQIVCHNSYYYTFQKGTVVKRFYYYNDTLLVRIEAFELKRRVRKDLDKGYGRRDGCIITDKDLDKDPTWKLTNIKLYNYDSLGRSQSFESPVPNSSHNRYEYEYDEEGRKVAERSYDQNRLIHTTYFEYTGNQVISVLKWDKNKYGGTKRIKTYNEQGKLVSESTIQGYKEWTDKYYYDENGRLKRFVAYDAKGEISLTHIYSYKREDETKSLELYAIEYFQEFVESESLFGNCCDCMDVTYDTTKTLCIYDSGYGTVNLNFVFRSLGLEWSDSLLFNDFSVSLPDIDTASLGHRMIVTSNKKDFSPDHYLVRFTKRIEFSGGTIIKMNIKGDPQCSGMDYLFLFNKEDEIIQIKEIPFCDSLG